MTEPGQRPDRREGSAIAKNRDTAGDVPILALKPADAAKALGVPYTTLMEYAKRGEIPYSTYGR